MIADKWPDTNYKVCKFPSNLMVHRSENDVMLSAPLSSQLHLSFQQQEQTLLIRGGGSKHLVETDSYSGSWSVPVWTSYLEWLTPRQLSPNRNSSLYNLKHLGELIANRD